jgi:hypothetical protein
MSHTMRNGLRGFQVYPAQERNRCLPLGQRRFARLVNDGVGVPTQSLQIGHQPLRDHADPREMDARRSGPRRAWCGPALPEGEV